MNINRPEKRHHPETIVALIDVVFFLLVFFMLIGRMDATSPYDIVPPSALGGPDLPAGGTTISVSSDGALALDATPVARDQIVARIADRLVTTPDLAVRINADQATELRHILPLVSRLEAEGATDIVFVVTPNAP